MGAQSRLRLWSSSNDRITLDYAQARVGYAESGERLRDRRGLVHRLAPTGDRYPVSLALTILPEELTRASEGTSPLAPTVLEWLDLHFRKQSELIVQVLGETLDSLGRPLNRYLAYRAVLEKLPEEGFATLPPGVAHGDWLEVELTVLEDGTFGNFEQPDFAGHVPLREGGE